MTSGRQALRAPVLLAAGIGVAALALRVHDPHREGSWGFCPFQVLTGWDCPGCGGLRAVNDLTHGRVVEAWHSNALFVTLVPVLLGVWVLWVARAWSGSGRQGPPRLSRNAGIGLAVVGLAFTVWRNTPAGSAWFAA